MNVEAISTLVNSIQSLSDKCKHEFEALHRKLATVEQKIDDVETSLTSHRHASASSFVLPSNPVTAATNSAPFYASNSTNTSSARIVPIPSVPMMGSMTAISPSANSSSNSRGHSDTESPETDNVAKELTKAIRQELARFEKPILVKLSPSSFSSFLVECPEFLNLIPATLSQKENWQVKELCKRKIKDAISNRKKSLKRKVGIENWANSGNQISEGDAPSEREKLKTLLIAKQYKTLHKIDDADIESDDIFMGEPVGACSSTRKRKFDHSSDVSSAIVSRYGHIDGGDSSSSL